MVDVVLSYLGEKFAFHKLDRCIKIGEEPVLLAKNSALWIFRSIVPHDSARKSTTYSGA